MPQKLHLNSRWLTILAGIFALIVLIKVGFDYWPEIKLLMHPTRCCGMYFSRRLLWAMDRSFDQLERQHPGESGSCLAV
ncbi:hypothetical protein [Limosilactobacillus mucosae]|uniref:hypothetical protein n=1 Tax=Limosilactobacillus mucosae TaxID=97478 RepID=UPI0022E24683|nr:hypothetical protein [Limosilactobacillus mucosae]